MKISQQVEELENKLERYKSLSGEILATIIVNTERENIKFISEGTAKKWREMIQIWEKRHKELSG